MITPRFSLIQTENTVRITIYAPYCSLSDLDISVEDNVFIFVCRPYYLRLNLPGYIVENDQSRSKFDVDTGEFTFTYDKINPGEDFKDLEFITKFLCKKIDVHEEGKRKIEVLASECDSQTVIESDIKYGFAMRGGYNFTHISDEFSDVFELNPFEVSLENRKSVRFKKEQIDFNAEHYIADYLEDDQIQEILQFDAPLNNIDKAKITFTNKELDLLKDLTNIEYNLSEIQIKYCFNSLLDILFAYCYDQRTTFYEGTCESGWTISTLSASFKYFDGFLSPKEAIVVAFRRSLTYPLYRSFKLSQKVLNDLKSLLLLGEKFILKCLIEVYDIFLNSSSRYVLNNLFIKDYITYIMKWDKMAWLDVVNGVLKLTISKEDLDLGLIEIETPFEGDFLAEKLCEMHLNRQELDSDDSSESDDSTTSSTYSSSLENENN